jgi:hypothetical protein
MQAPFALQLDSASASAPNGGASMQESPNSGLGPFGKAEDGPATAMDTPVPSCSALAPADGGNACTLVCQGCVCICTYCACQPLLLQGAFPFRYEA